MSMPPNDPSPSVPMDPQLKSALTSMGMVASTAIAGWAASKGFISSGDQATIANALIALAGGVVTVGLAYWKTREHTPTALVATVNSDAVKGVKAVADDAKNASVPPVVVDPTTGRVTVDTSIPPKP